MEDKIKYHEKRIAELERKVSALEELIKQIPTHTWIESSCIPKKQTEE